MVEGRVEQPLGLQSVHQRDQAGIPGPTAEDNDRRRCLPSGIRPSMVAVLVALAAFTVIRSRTRPYLSAGHTAYGTVANRPERDHDGLAVWEVRGSSPLSSTHLSRAPNTAGPGDEDRVVDPSTTESDTARTLLDPKGASCLTRTSSSNAQHLAGQVGLSCSSSGSKQPTRGEILGVGPSGPQPFSARSAPPVGPETRSVDRLGRRAGTRCSGRRATPDADLILAYGRSPSPDACGPPRCCGPSCATSQQPQAP